MYFQCLILILVAPNPIFSRVVPIRFKDHPAKLYITLEVQEQGNLAVFDIYTPKAVNGWISIGFGLRSMWPADVVTCQHKYDIWKCQDSYISGSAVQTHFPISLEDTNVELKWGGSNNLSIDQECYPDERHFQLKKDLCTADPFDFCFASDDPNIYLIFAYHPTERNQVVLADQQPPKFFKHHYSDKIPIKDLHLDFSFSISDNTDERLNVVELIPEKIYMSIVRAIWDQKEWNQITLNVTQVIQGWLAVGVGRKSVQGHTYVGDISLIYVQDGEWIVYDCWATGMYDDPLFVKDDGSVGEHKQLKGSRQYTNSGQNNVQNLTITRTDGFTQYTFLKRYWSTDPTADIWDWDFYEGKNQALIAYHISDSNFPSRLTVPTEGRSMRINIKMRTEVIETIKEEQQEIPLEEIEPEKSPNVFLTIIFGGIIVFVTYLTF